MLAAAAYTGDFDPEFFGGTVPQGPAVLTAFPFLPRTDPDRVLDGPLPGPADPDALIGVQIEDVFTPDPAALYREAFSVPADGSAASVDVADALSGALVRFGLARAPDPLSFQVKLSGALRPGVDDSGGRIVLEILESLDLPAGGAAIVRVVALDRLGNVADIAQPEAVTLRAHGRARIVSPDADADPTRETVTLLTSAGVEVVLDAEGAPGGADAIVVDGGGVPGRVDVQAP
jgi:hypothetical protein